MNVRIKPGKLKGIVNIPPSKSLAHRAIIAACLAKGKSVISNVALSEDITATIEGMKSLGAQIEIEGDKLHITGSKIKRVNNTINCNESGSTLRFLIPLSLVVEDEITFLGENRLVKRPLDIYFSLFDTLGIKYERTTSDYLPLKIKGALKACDYYVKGDVSSQFITGLLFSLPLLDGDSKIIITTKLESKGYVDLTLDILSKFGIKATFNENIIEIPGNQEYKPFDYRVEGDYSQSAFYLLANMLGNDIKLKGLDTSSYQGDKKILKDIVDFGGVINIEKDLLWAEPKTLIPAKISFAQTPDLGPALTVLASTIEGKSEFVDASRLRIKECDRITCMREELEKLGGIIKEFEDGMFINGTKLHGGIVDSHNDHRVVMALSMISTIIDDDLIITNAGAIKKSYPNFFEDFKSLGGNISYE